MGAKTKTPARVNPEAAVPSGCSLLGPREICAVLRVCDRQRRALVATGRFPRPDFCLGGSKRQPRWRESTVRQWIESQSSKGA